MTYRAPVTAHAVLRYLKRIEGFDLRPLVERLGRNAGNWTLARAACAEMGVDITEVQRRICPEHLAEAVHAGAGRIRRPGMILFCQNGLVTTVTSEIHVHRMRQRSKREIRQYLQRSIRRR